jgi:hypothetical protein
MVKSILLAVMMVTTSMAMDAVKIVTFKLDSHVMVDLQAQKIPARPYCHQLFQLKTEANQDFTER